MMGGRMEECVDEFVNGRMAEGVGRGMEEWVVGGWVEG